MATNSERLTYAAAQTARVAFYGAHYLAARLVARDAFAEIDPPKHRLPSLRATLFAMRDLFRQDWANAEAGHYPLPLNLRDEMRRAQASLRFLADIPKVAARRRRHGHDETPAKGQGLPRYYRQNFHFQTDGYLSADSAKLYDFQVEALFAGTADAMRRRAFMPVAEALKGRSLSRARLLDIGAGTGRFLSLAKSALPELRAVALDLSEPYLERARRALRHVKGISFVGAPAEAIPLADGSIDVAIGIYLFHELPPKIRTAVAREIGRVLKPGGTFVLSDSIQFGDAPEFDGLIEVFPDLVYEPYYAGYTKCDLDALFAPAGLHRIATDIAYLTKIAVFQKPRSKRRRSVHES
ncbi:MAG TPA: class I SAM-dependent methyltransferase [Rhizomicrobium sp.]|jgi:ubiquinone/menaquinone biosynthesis C-methylase UbiE